MSKKSNNSNMAKVSLTTSGSNGHPLCSTKNKLNLDICIVSAPFVCIWQGDSFAHLICWVVSAIFRMEPHCMKDFVETLIVAVFWFYAYCYWFVIFHSILWSLYICGFLLVESFSDVIELPMLWFESDSCHFKLSRYLIRNMDEQRHFEYRNKI